MNLLRSIFLFVCSVLIGGYAIGPTSFGNGDLRLVELKGLAIICAYGSFLVISKKFFENTAHPRVYSYLAALPGPIVYAAVLCFLIDVQADSELDNFFSPENSCTSIFAHAPFSMKRPQALEKLCYIDNFILKFESFPREQQAGNLTRARMLLASRGGESLEEVYFFLLGLKSAYNKKLSQTISEGEKVQLGLDFSKNSLEVITWVTPDKPGYEHPSTSKIVSQAFEDAKKPFTEVCRKISVQVPSSLESVPRYQECTELRNDISRVNLAVQGLLQ